ncbi:hypothetical protein CHU98_g11381, partial [Xylaria longipes]
MASHNTPRGPNRKAKPITSFSKSTKPLVAASQKADGASSSSTIPPLSETTSTKRKASTSVPSSPTTLQPPLKKHSTLGRFLPDLNSTRLLTLRPAEAFVSPTAWTLSPLMSDGETDLDLGSASDRSVSVSSQSTDSLASSRGNTRASGARVRRDVADVRRVLRTIKQVKEGTYKVKKGGLGGKYLIQRTLHYSGYKLLREELKKEENQELLAYVNRRLRFDYTRRPYKGDKQFVIHLPSEFHDSMAGQFLDTIVGWLPYIRNGTLCKDESSKDETMRIASEINSTLASRVECFEPRDDHLEPDLSFAYEDCDDADLVVQVAWSQSKLKFPDRATRYINGTKGAIRTVVGLNMNDIYRGGCRATFSVWKAEQDGDKWKPIALVDNKQFIDENGKVVDDCMLRLSLKDFLCARMADGFRDFEDVPLEISSTQLYGFYKYAFKRQVRAEAKKEIKEVQKKVGDALEMIISAEKLMQEQRTEDARKVMRKKELADVRNLLSKVEDEISEMKKTIASVEENIDK